MELLGEAHFITPAYRDISTTISASAHLFLTHKEYASNVCVEKGNFVNLFADVAAAGKVGLWQLSGQAY
ncbi:hypothetical protein [Sodalis glossinidius]|uniref:hypothetical protein n=1 Tax=Sodalis glossinidius TaxID=63612 RepID=UPI0011D0E59B|nr:hypothetical protein [Sodalis glossinidius]